MRLTEKTLISADGQPSRVKRRFDQARMPFGHLSETNPFAWCCSGEDGGCLQNPIYTYSEPERRGRLGNIL